MKLLVSQQVEVDCDEGLLHDFLNHLNKELSQSQTMWPSSKELVVAFVSVDTSHNLNKSYRGKDRPTDVLSFTSDDPDIFGELILCWDVVCEQANTNQWPPDIECCYMVLHGILHLLGYDHESDDNRAHEMYSLQDSVFFAWGPAKPFASKT